VATTLSADMTSSASSKPSRSRARWLALGLFLGLLALAVVACGTATTSPSPNSSAAAAVTDPSPAPNATEVASPQPTATPEPEPLMAAQPSDLWGLINWAFTPIFQALFIILADVYALTGNVLIAIVVLTLLIRIVTFRLSARQLVSQKRMQILQPELRTLNKELERRYKGDRGAIMQAQQAFYRERGVSPTAGCLPAFLQMGMLIPMYSVIRIGLTNFNPSAMFSVFDLKVVPITCPNPDHYVNQVLDKSLPCINTVVAGIDMGKEQVLFNLDFPGIGAGFLSIPAFTLGISALAVAAAFLQLIQSRMMMPPPAENDPSASTQRSMMIFMPLISLLYGGILPAGLFIYWIVTSLFSIVQQFLIVGWGSMFPLFGWDPAFARGYQPRFPVTMPEVTQSGSSVAATRLKPDERRASAASTVRPNAHRRSSRRGRRR
jgi:YidC/Oxa1 family membrane protein insertase